MLHYYRFFALLLLVCSLFGFTGCGPKGPVVYPVTGIVTLDGKPIQGASVSFLPKQAASEDDISGPLEAYGQTDADGKYFLSTTRGSAIDGGTTVGEYNVTVAKMRMANAPPTDSSGGGGGFVPRFEYTIPQVFDKAETAKISVEVVKGKNTFNFVLKSDGTHEVTK